MGNTNSDFKNAQLSSIPPEQKLQVFGEQYCNKQPVSMTAIEQFSSFPREQFKILDSKGELMYKMEGLVFSTRDKKKLYDRTGHCVGAINHKLFCARHILNIFDNRGSKVAVVRRSGCLQFSVKVKCWIKRNGESINTHRVPDIIMTGDWRTKNLIFTNAYGQVIAKVQRRTSNLRNVLGKQTYECIVASNVDNSFIAILIVCLDEIYQHNRH